MHQAVETEKLEASENVAGGPVVQNHHHDEKQLLLGSIIFFLSCGEMVFHGSFTFVLSLIVPKIQSPESFLGLSFQRTTLRDKVYLSLGQGEGLLPACYTKTRSPHLSALLSCNPHC